MSKPLGYDKESEPIDLFNGKWHDWFMDEVEEEI